MICPETVISVCYIDDWGSILQRLVLALILGALLGTMVGVVANVLRNVRKKKG